MPSREFRPKHPRDPFAALDGQYTLRSLPTRPCPPQIILVLGHPKPQEIRALVTSPFLASSLLLIATHAPAPLSHLINHHGHAPYIRLLHLPAPLSPHDPGPGALRLVSLYERAQRVGAAWRVFLASSAKPKSIPPSRFQQLAEDPRSGEFTLVEAVAPYPVSPHSKPSHSPKTPKLSPAQLTSTLSNNRGFDAILNFLPPVPHPLQHRQSAIQSDKALLKHAILVTTLAAAYLASPPTSTNTPVVNHLLHRTPSPPSTGQQQQQQQPHRYHYQRRLSSSPPSAPSLSIPPKAYIGSHSRSVSAATTHSVHSATPTDEIPVTVPVKTKRRLSSVLLASIGFGSDVSPSTPPPRGVEPNTRTIWQNAHVIHVLPPTSYSASGSRSKKTSSKSKLVQGIEQFLLTFAYPQVPIQLHHDHPFSDSSSLSRGLSHSSSYLGGVEAGDGRSRQRWSMYDSHSHSAPTSYNQNRHSVASVSSIASSSTTKRGITPYLIDASLFAKSVGDGATDRNVPGVHTMTLGECVVLGMLDDGAGGEGDGGYGAFGRRAWIGVGDVRFGAAGEKKVVSGDDEDGVFCRLGPEKMESGAEMQAQVQPMTQTRPEAQVHTQIQIQTHPHPIAQPIAQPITQPKTNVNPKPKTQKKAEPLSYNVPIRVDVVRSGLPTPPRSVDGSAGCCEELVGVEDSSGSGSGSAEGRDVSCEALNPLPVLQAPSSLFSRSSSSGSSSSSSSASGSGSGSGSSPTSSSASAAGLMIIPHQRQMERVKAHYIPVRVVGQRQRELREEEGGQPQGRRGRSQQQQQQQQQQEIQRSLSHSYSYPDKAMNKPTDEAVDKLKDVYPPFPSRSELASQPADVHKGKGTKPGVELGLELRSGAALDLDLGLGRVVVSLDGGGGGGAKKKRGGTGIVRGVMRLLGVGVGVGVGKEKEKARG